MFDRYIVRPGPSYSEHTHREYRAPTDQSVALLKEMQREAKAEVLKSVRLEDNDFQGVVHTMFDYMGDQRIFKCLFKLNGTQHEVTLNAPNHYSKDKIALAIRDKIAESISNKITENLLKGLGNLF
jgi:hypothetical protein